jgi:hypothetical protein
LDDVARLRNKGRPVKAATKARSITRSASRSHAEPKGSQVKKILHLKAVRCNSVMVLCPRLKGCWSIRRFEVPGF